MRPFNSLRGLANRKLVLFNIMTMTMNFTDFGVQTSILRYQVPRSVDDHIFYAGNGG